ncbi:MAG: F-type H+-transporting ATPase subunit gamma [Rhodospirillaceae bacterium]|jgi:F-type H+-transporting ATPase subunit gamma|nr:F-type H+-transporting ATPase subunit gamma [Rhodospirillaceae bacterium]
MPSLKDLKVRINSVKSTQKITSAMKMVAAAKLRRAQEKAEAARPYAERMERMLGSLAASMAGRDGAPALLAGNGRDQVHLVVVMTSDRGLCGGFNSSIVRAARRKVRELLDEGKQVKLFCVGRKGRDQLRRDLADLIVGHVEDVGRPRLAFPAAASIGARLVAMYEAGEFDVCHLVYNKFKSAMTQIVTIQQLIPFAVPAGETTGDAVYEYEPDENEILEALLPRNLGVQVFRALLENTASEEGARMTAMDSATRNAGEMINKLTIFYNRSRQAYITKELIEIISGAEAI